MPVAVCADLEHSAISAMTLPLSAMARSSLRWQHDYEGMLLFEPSNLGISAEDDSICATVQGSGPTFFFPVFLWKQPQCVSLAWLV